MRVARFPWCIILPVHRRRRRRRCADRVVCRTTIAIGIMTCSPAPRRQSVANRRMRWTRHRYRNQKGSATTTVPSWRYDARPRRERPHISYTHTVREMWIATWCLGFVLFSCPNCLYVCVGRAAAQNKSNCDSQSKSLICSKEMSCVCRLYAVLIPTMPAVGRTSCPVIVYRSHHHAGIWRLHARFIRFVRLQITDRHWLSLLISLSS